MVNRLLDGVLFVLLLPHMAVCALADKTEWRIFEWIAPITAFPGLLAQWIAKSRYQ